MTIKIDIIYNHVNDSDPYAHNMSVKVLNCPLADHIAAFPIEHPEIRDKSYVNS